MGKLNKIDSPNDWLIPSNETMFIAEQKIEKSLQKTN